MADQYRPEHESESEDYPEAQLLPEMPRRGSGRFWSRFFFVVLILGVCLAFLGSAALVGAWFWISRDLPRIERLADYSPPAVTQVLASDGSLMAEFAHQRRYVVSLDKIPRVVINAFVSAEDGEFFDHVGVSLFGMLRATWVNLKAGRFVQGGSTITQQVARGLLLTPQRTMLRKLKEIILAYRIEKYLSKDEILYLYLNQIYLGNGAYGVQAASQTFFGKDTSELGAAEGALLAGLVKAPSRYSPVRYPRRARTRQEYVIGRMVADGHLTQEEANHALNKEIPVSLHEKATVQADHYVEYVRQWLEERYGAATLYEGGLTVQTACDPNMTKAAKKSIEDGLMELTDRQGFKGPVGKVGKEELKDIKSRAVSSNGLEPGQVVKAVVTRVSKGNSNLRLRMGPARGRVLKGQEKFLARYGKSLLPGDEIMVKLVQYSAKDKTWYVNVVQEPVADSALLALEAGTGRVRAMIGGRDFSKSQFNRAIQAHRQPGSAFKPFIFTAALDSPDHRWTPSSIVLDTPVVYDDPNKPGAKWKPKNYENRFFGENTLRTALEHSRNVSTVKVLADLGLPDTIAYAHKFGFTSELAPNLSLALGTSAVTLMELTKAYSVFANEGKLVEPVIIEKVVDRRGEEIYQATSSEQQVITPQIAFLTTHLLRGVVLHGTGTQMIELDRPLAGKTGTTNDLRDAWFVGFSPQLVCGVWVGQDDNDPLGHRETGARAAGPIWKEFMGQALKDMPKLDFPVPEGVVFTRVDLDSGLPVTAGEQGGFFEAFLAGTEPQAEMAGVKREEPSSPTKGADDFLQNETFTEAPTPQPELGQINSEPAPFSESPFGQPGASAPRSR